MRRKAIFRQLAETLFALIITYIAGKWAINYAYTQRGYEAAGGEYIFILFVYFVSYKFIRRMFDIAKSIKEGG
jgi:hypothetical protein